jgi:Protein of unknown function (DUF938)
MVHISPWEATLGLMRGAAAMLSSGAPLYLYGPYLREGIDKRRRAIKPSTGASAVATRTGVCVASRRLLRWRNPLDSLLRLSPKCPQTI